MRDPQPSHGNAGNGPAARVGDAASCGNLRDPNGPQSTFASESFIDELAAAANADAVEFRLKLLTGSTAEDSGFKRARSIAVVKAAAQAYGWTPRVAGRAGGPGGAGGSGGPGGPGRAGAPGGAGTANRAGAAGEILTGRGIAYAFRGQTVVAEIAEVEVNRTTGHVWVKRLVCAHDCGLVINRKLRRTIEGGMLHSEPRASRGSAVRPEDDGWIGFRSLAQAHDTCEDRHRAGERRSQSESARPSALRSRRDRLQAAPRRGRQCHLRRDRGATASRAVQGCAGAGGAQGRGRGVSEITTQTRRPRS